MCITIFIIGAALAYCCIKTGDNPASRKESDQAQIEFIRKYRGNVKR